MVSEAVGLSELGRQAPLVRNRRWPSRCSNELRRRLGRIPMIQYFVSNARKTSQRNKINKFITKQFRTGLDDAAIDLNCTARWLKKYDWIVERFRFITQSQWLHRRIVVRNPR